jgi:hypothetical protein
MKYLFSLLISSFCLIFGFSQNHLKLEIPDDLYYKRLSKTKHIIAALDSGESHYVSFLYSEKSKNSGIIDSNTVINKKIGYFFAIPHFSSYSVVNGGSKYLINFGDGISETSSYGASVSIENVHQDSILSPDLKEFDKRLQIGYQNLITQEFGKIDSSGIIINVTKVRSTNELPDLVKVIIPSQSRIKISIDHDTAKTNVIVCIFDNKGYLLSRLDPNILGDPSEESCIINETVYIVPFIRPNRLIQTSYWKEEVIFNVGDPVKSGSIKVTEGDGTFR